MSPPKSVSELVDTRRVLLCVGCGGVGKTTVAASLGVLAARRGKRVLTLTIDPAKRLAQSLGLDRMTTDEQQVPREILAEAGVDTGTLTVMMLDTKRTFDDLVRRHASSAETRDRILQNRLYRHLSTHLAGTQDYMAMEKLLAVKDDPRFDLVVLDTPPTRNALDFLEAPDRLIEALDGQAIRWFVQAFDRSRSFSLNFLAQGVAAVLRGVGKLTGAGFLEQMAELVSDLDDLFGGFRERASRVAGAFRAPDVAYVMVTSPDPLAIQEVAYFSARLRDHGIRSDVLVVNRVHEPPESRPTEAEIDAALRRRGLELGPSAVSRIRRAVDDEARLAARDALSLGEIERLRVREEDTGVPLVRIAALAGDVHDVATLAGIASALSAPPG